jgi:hypothetical protein
MPKVGLQNIEVGGNTTFQTWLESHNDLVDLMKTDVVTVSPLPGGDVAVGNATIQGTFTANTIVASTGINANNISSITTGTNIDVVDPIRFVTTSTNNVATFLNNNGARTRYSTSAVSWNVGLETGAATSFIIATGSGDPQFRVSANGEISISNLTVSNTIVGTSRDSLKLSTPRTISMSGDVVWNSGNFDGSANVSSSSSIQNNVVTDQKIRQSVGLSVIGRSASTTGNVADISAGSDHQVLRRSGTSIGFGALNLSQPAAVSGILPIANGGTGSSSAAAARAALGAQAAFNVSGILTQTGPDTFAGRTISQGTGISVANGDGVSGNPTVAVTTASVSEIQSLSGTNKLPTTSGIATAASLTTPSGASNWMPDWSNFISATWVLTGNRTLENPVNVIAGTTRVVRVASDSITRRVITWGTNYKGFLTPSVTNTAVALITLYAVSSNEIVVSAVEYTV